MTPATEPVATAAAWRERLYVPASWWLIALFFLVSVFVAIAFYLGPLNGALATLVAAGIVVAVLVPYGNALVTVDDQALTVGPSRIEWRWIAGAVALDRSEARRRLGPDADARALLVTRPYLPESVEVTLDDPADPHPYWLIGSRRATGLAAAINSRAGSQSAKRAHG